MDREIKVTKCGVWEDCEYNDRIIIEFSPMELLKFAQLFEQRALDAENYSDQTAEREMHDGFTTAREIWEKERREKDK